MNLLYDHVIPAKTGHSIELKRGQHLRLIDVEGKQVVDMAVFNLHNVREKVSPSYYRTRRTPKPGAAYRALDKLVEGDYIRSTIGAPMLQIVKETAEPKGIHDTYIRMCNRQLYDNYGVGPREGCFETISRLVEPYGLQPEDLPDPMNVFMNLEHSCTEGRWVTKEPVTKPGDYIEFKAEMDCLVAFSNCPEDMLTPCNGYHCTPVQVQIYGDVTP